MTVDKVNAALNKMLDNMATYRKDDQFKIMCTRAAYNQIFGDIRCGGTTTEENTKIPVEIVDGNGQDGIFVIPCNNEKPIKIYFEGSRVDNPNIEDVIKTDYTIANSPPRGFETIRVGKRFVEDETDCNADIDDSALMSILNGGGFNVTA